MSDQAIPAPDSVAPGVRAIAATVLTMVTVAVVALVAVVAASVFAPFNLFVLFFFAFAHPRQVARVDRGLLGVFVGRSEGVARARGEGVHVPGTAVRDFVITVTEALARFAGDEADPVGAGGERHGR